MVSKFTYTLESLIQAGKSLVAVTHVPVSTNPKTRESRLFPSMWTYIRRNMGAIFRIYTGYEPLQIFSLLAACPRRCAASLAWTPLLWDWLVHGDRSGHLQSVIFGAVLLLAAVQVFVLGVIADLVAANREVTQRALERVRRIELQLGVPPTHYRAGHGPARCARAADPAGARTGPGTGASRRDRARPAGGHPGPGCAGRARRARPPPVSDAPRRGYASSSSTGTAATWSSGASSTSRRLDWPRDRLDLVVVDNASTDGSDRVIAERFPGVRLVRNDANDGFVANNLALRDLDDVDYVGLVNADSFVEPGLAAAAGRGAGGRRRAGRGLGPHALRRPLPRGRRSRRPPSCPARPTCRELGVMVSGARVDGKDRWRDTQFGEGTWGIEHDRAAAAPSSGRRPPAVVRVPGARRLGDPAAAPRPARHDRAAPGRRGAQGRHGVGRRPVDDAHRVGRARAGAACRWPGSRSTS